MTSSTDSGFLFLRLWLASLIAQLGYFVASVFTLAGVAALAGVSSDSLGEGLLKFGILTVFGLGLLLPASFFVVPMFLKPLVRAFAGRKLSFGWAFLANLAATLLVILTMGLLLLIPGAQPIVAIVAIVFASAVCAALIQALGGLSEKAKESFQEAKKLASSVH